MRRYVFLLALSAVMIIGGCGDSKSGTSSEVSPKDTVSQVDPTPSDNLEPSSITDSTPTSSPAPITPTSPTTSSEQTPAQELSPSPISTEMSTPPPSSPSTTMEPQAEMPPTIPPEFEPTMANHFGFMPAFYDYTSAAEAGAAWDRPHFEMFT